MWDITQCLEPMIKIYIWTVQGKLPSGRAAATARCPTLTTHSGVLTRHRTITDSVRGSIVVTIVKVILRRVSHLFFLRECLCFFTLTLNTSVINVHFLFWRVIFTTLRGQTKREVFMSSPFKEHLAATWQLLSNEGTQRVWNKIAERRGTCTK